MLEQLADLASGHEPASDDVHYCESQLLMQPPWQQQPIAPP